MPAGFEGLERLIEETRFQAVKFVLEGTLVFKLGWDAAVEINLIATSILSAHKHLKIPHI